MSLSASAQRPATAREAPPSATRPTLPPVLQAESHFFLIVTEPLQIDVGSVTYGTHLNSACGAIDEFGMAGTVTFLDLVKSPGQVVAFFDTGKRREHRNLVLPVSLPAGTAGWRQHVPYQSDAPSFGGLCFW